MKSKELTSWVAVDKALKEETASGYALACIEARKVLLVALRNNKIPADNLKQTLRLFGWKFSNVDELQKAIDVCDHLINKVDYNLSTFQAEDTVEAFKIAVLDLADESKKVTWQKGLTMAFHKDTNGFDFKKVLIIGIGAISLLKFLTETELGKTIATLSNKLFDLLVYIFIIGLVVSVLALIVFLFLDRKKEPKITKIVEK